VDIAVLRSADLKPIQPDAANEHGFSQFFLYCIKCHSINSIGGSLGPELNLPCSVTEYWNPRLLDAFIAQPDAVRQSSKMPGFQSVPESDRAAIVNYLQYMASHKSGNKGECH
jgi:cytochrome c2